MGETSWIVAPEPAAAAAGVDVLEAGGSAIDAAIGRLARPRRRRSALELHRRFRGGALLNLIDHRLHPQLAVTLPRFSAWGRRLTVEAGVSPPTVRALEKLGWAVTVLPDAFDDEHTGRVMPLSRLGSTEWEGGADPRGGGVALRVQRN